MNVTKKYLLRGIAIAAFFMGAGLYAQSPVGAWKTIDDETGQPKSYVNIWEQNGVVYGTITKLINPDKPNPLCDKCSGDYYNKPIEGMTIMWGLKQDGSEYTGGQILDPKTGKVYNCKIKVEGNTLIVRGFIGFSLIGRSQTWYRQ